CCVLDMKILRHKEFEEGCKSPYDGKWSKTMVGFGPEDDDFVAELINKYRSSQAVSTAKRPYLAEAPGGYRFCLVDIELPPNDPVQKLCQAGSDLQESIRCFSLVKGKESNEETVLMEFAYTPCKLELHNIVGTVDHGRIELSCPREQLADLEALMTKGNHKILTILVSLDTPGKVWLAWTPLGRLGLSGHPWEGLISLDTPGKAWLAWTSLGRLGLSGHPWEGLISLDTPGKAWLAWTPLGRLGCLDTPGKAWLAWTPLGRLD
uniref:Uncharacterized protein n=1 Tax=Oncorhynchus tshawytscha TaxID=74940 RepID=A0AAZ3Q833_ONCTS